MIFFKCEDCSKDCKWRGDDVISGCHSTTEETKTEVHTLFTEEDIAVLKDDALGGSEHLKMQDGQVIVFHQPDPNVAEIADKMVGAEVTHVIVDESDTISVGTGETLSGVEDKVLFEAIKESLEYGDLKPEVAVKHDEGKPDWSLVPLWVHELAFATKVKGSKEWLWFVTIHRLLNGKIIDGSIKGLLEEMLQEYGVNTLEHSLSYGAEKYSRDNYVKGYGDPNRSLRAFLRHCKAVIEGKLYDGEVLDHPRFQEGNNHIGAMQFCLMAYLKETKQV